MTNRATTRTIDRHAVIATSSKPEPPYPIPRLLYYVPATPMLATHSIRGPIEVLYLPHITSSRERNPSAEKRKQRVSPNPELGALSSMLCPIPCCFYHLPVTPMFAAHNRRGPLEVLCLSHITRFSERNFSPEDAVAACGLTARCPVSSPVPAGTAGPLRSARRRSAGRVDSAGFWSAPAPAASDGSPHDRPG